MLAFDFDRKLTLAQTELAVHKKKVEQVEGWLRDALDGRAALQKYRVGAVEACRRLR